MSEMIIESLEEYGLSSESKPKQLFSRIGIVGCGSVGQQIALVISQNELEVVFIELTEEKINQGLKNIEAKLDDMIEHWGMTPGEKRAILSRIKGHVGFEHLEGCDMVIESIRSQTRERFISERIEVFQSIEKHVSPSCIIATNSITAVITELASQLEHKERCVSLNFIAGSSKSTMIEVVKGLYTSEKAYESVLKFIEMLDKEAVSCLESAGLVSARLFVVQLNEACDILMEGVASLDDIDKTVRVGRGQTLGPFEMADKIGLDKIGRWMNILYKEFGDRKYIISPVVRRLIRSNQLGRLTGSGFYVYDENGKVKSNL